MAKQAAVHGERAIAPHFRRDNPDTEAQDRLFLAITVTFRGSLHSRMKVPEFDAPAGDPEVKLAALFRTRSKEAALAAAFAANHDEMIPSSSLPALLLSLRRCDVAAVLLEDTGPELIDRLAILRMRETASLPVIVVSGVGVGMCEALANGATDYVDIADSLDPLIARVRAHAGMRRTLNPTDIEIGPYSLCVLTSAVQYGGREVNLTHREFALAWLLFSNAGRTVSGAQLAARVWGKSADLGKRTLEQHVYKLRRKLCAVLGASIRIQAVYSIGYRLDVLDGQAHRRTDGVCGQGLDTSPHDTALSDWGDLQPRVPEESLRP